MLLFIDNYDSFTYNLVDYFGQLTQNLKVFRNDAITLDEIRALQPSGIVLSPGPGTPDESGVCLEVIEKLSPEIPVLGICLGHQSIGQVFGAKIVRAQEPVHGKVSKIYHDGDPLFTGISSPFPATRYHSLIINPKTLPDELKTIAYTEDGIIMAIRHSYLSVVGGGHSVSPGINFNQRRAKNAEKLVHKHSKREGIIMKEILEKIACGQNLTRTEAREALQLIIDDAISATQAGALLMGLRQKGESVDEINGFLDVLTEHMVKVPLQDDQAIDVCGTGGDGKGTFNISTTVAFVLAAAGVTVAKHGNRSISSKAGSADLLEALGANIQLNAEQAKQCADEIKITFFFAPLYHPAMKNIAPHRKSLNMRTVFNMLGPLLNPAGVKRQLIGAFNAQAAEMMANVVLERGHDYAYVVHSSDGLDEVSPFSTTRVHEVKAKERQLNHFEFNGFQTSGELNEILGQSAEQNAEKLKLIFKGKKGADRDIVLLNSAFALKAAGKVNTIDQGIQLAAEVIDSGSALQKVKQFVEMSNSFN